MTVARQPNALIHEASSYLQQHAYNPVNWLPWSQATLDLAVKEDKLLIISIGYAACHWCHVMEEESFEDPGVAEVMNTSFIAVKVDREERPDIDLYYMNACQLLSGRGGWPLNVIAMPDQRPFFAGTYFRKQEWLQILRYFAGEYTKNGSILAEQSIRITRELEHHSRPVLESGNLNIGSGTFRDMWVAWKRELDFQYGGRSGAPKFPMPVTLEFLLRLHEAIREPDILDYVRLTLDNMAFGGIYDQVGGGFSRYSVDEEWHIPHFEKMLYDNAQLVSLYSKAYRLTGSKLYKNVIGETLGFADRELLSENGLYYSSLDADSEGLEGTYYCWKAAELSGLFPESHSRIMDYYNISEEGNWEQGKNVLMVSGSARRRFFQEDQETLQELLELEKARQEMFRYRLRREPPRKDQKLLTCWNAMMISAWSDAFRALQHPLYLEKAQHIAGFYLKRIRDKSHDLGRNFAGDRFTSPALLDDYAFLIRGLLDLYQVSFDENLVMVSTQLTTFVLEQFFDEKTGMFSYARKTGSDIQGRINELNDQVIPSCNSMMARNMFVLGHLSGIKRFTEKAREMASRMAFQVVRNPYFYSSWGCLIADFIFPVKEISVVGPGLHEWMKEIYGTPLQGAIFSGSTSSSDLPPLIGKFSEGNTRGYCCVSNTCSEPCQNPLDLLNIL